MEFLAMLYTVLLVAICLMMALLLFRSGRPTGGLDEADCEELKDWLEEQLAAQAREFNARQDAIAQQNYAAIRSVSETLQTAVQSMSTTLGQGQDSQQRILERRLQSLEQANNQQMEQLRRAMVESMTALQAENTRKLDEIRHTVDEQLQDALQKRVTESFKAVNQQLEQVYKGLGEMQSLAADVGGLKQVLSGVKTRASSARSSWARSWKRSSPRSSMTPTSPPSRAAPSGWNTPSGCRVPTAAASGSPSTPSSPATPTPTYRTPTLPATRRPWRMPATPSSWCSAARPESSGKSTSSRLIPRRSASCSCPLRACMPRW